MDRSFSSLEWNDEELKVLNSDDVLSNATLKNFDREATVLRLVEGTRIFHTLRLELEKKIIRGKN